MWLRKSLKIRSFCSYQTIVVRLGQGGWTWTYLSVNMRFTGCGEQLFESSNSNLRLTGPRELGRMAIGDIERRVWNVRLVGEGDSPYGSLMPARLLQRDSNEIGPLDTTFAHLPRGRRTRTAYDICRKRHLQRVAQLGIASDGPALGVQREILPALRDLQRGMHSSLVAHLAGAHVCAFLLPELRHARRQTRQRARIRRQRTKASRITPCTRRENVQRRCG